MPHKIIGYTTLMCFSLAVFFGFGEILTRIFYQPQEIVKQNDNKRIGKNLNQFDSLLGWRHFPNVRVTHQMPGYSCEYEINAKGIRSRKNYSYNKPHNMRRIVLIGDSFTFGHGVGEQDRYSDKLEEKFKNTEVINMGTSGYSTAQQYLFLKTEGMKYEPDLVIVGLYITNIRRNLDSISRPRFKVINDSLELSNYPLHQIDSLTVSDDENETTAVDNFIVRYSRFIQFINDKINYVEKRLDPLPEYEDGNEGWTLLKSLLLEIRKTAAGAGSKTLIVLIPHHSYYGGNMSKYASRHPFEQMKKFSDEHDYFFIDLLPLFEKYAVKKNWKDLVIEGDGHWNAKGHEMASDSIFQFILSYNLLSHDAIK